MESSSDPASPLNQPNHRLADLIGAAIALLTLALPLVAIAHYSANRPENTPPQTFRLNQPVPAEPVKY